MLKKITVKVKSVISFVKKNAKKLAIATAGVALAATTSEVILNQPISETDLITKIDQSQIIYFQQHGKYQQGLKNDDWKTKLGISKDIPYTIRIDEFQYPDGQKGYRALIESDTFIKSIGHGKDAQHWTWQEIKTPYINTTSTIL